MQMSNLTLCYEAIQRVYRNAVVGLLRQSLTRAFPDDFKERLRKPFGPEEWKQIEENAFKTRISGQLAAQVADDFDLLSVSHFFNLFELYYDHIVPIPQNADKVQKRSDKKRVLEWARTVKDLRDPCSHPAEEDFNYEDSFVLMDCARRVLLQLRLHEDAQTVKRLMTSLSGHGHMLGEPLEADLPPSEAIVCDFVGREKELSVLWDWLSNPTTRRWALAGAGGTGKTAIAYKFALEVRDQAPEPLQAVIWLSAKKKRFAEGQIVLVSTPDFEDLDSALNQVLFQYGWIEEITNSTELKKARALALFDEFPSLVIVDDIDSVEKADEDAIEFFTFNVPQSKSKVLLTSRRTVFGMANTTTEIEGFSESDVGRFVTSRCLLFNLDRQIFTSQVVKSVVAATQGSPLYIEDLMRLMTVVPAKEAIKAWADQKGQNVRQYALGRELEMLPREATHVLIAACLYDTAVSYEELRAVTGYPDGTLTDCLSRLQGLFLVPKPKVIEGEARFEINTNVRALVGEVEGKTNSYKAVEAAYRSVSGTLPRVGRGDIASYVRQAVLLVKNFEEVEAERLLVRALEIHPNDPDLIGVLGMVYRRMRPPRYTDARNCFVRSHQLNNKGDEMYKHWARMEVDSGEWTKAAEAAELGLKKKPHSKQLLYLAGRARSGLGKEMLSRRQEASAEVELRRSLDHLDQALARRGSSGDERDLNTLIYRGIVISAYLLNDRSRLLNTFSAWFRDFPDDPDASSEWSRISARVGISRSDLDIP